MKFIETTLPGLTVIEPQVFSDSRGFFMETFNRQKFADADLDINAVQDNLSYSTKGILRGLHYQHPQGQGKLVGVLYGSVYDVVVNIQRGSATFGNWFGCEISAKNKKQLWIPPGFAHGFCVTSESAVFVYKCTDFYAPECEFTIRWNDPDLGIDWPVNNPVVSNKDANGFMLKDISPNNLP